MPCLHGHKGCPGGLLGVADVKKCLGPLDLLSASEKEHERSRRVAMGGGGCRTIFCTVCRQVVGVVEKKTQQQQQQLEVEDLSSPSPSKKRKRAKAAAAGGGGGGGGGAPETVGCPTCSSRYCSECG